MGVKLVFEEQALFPVVRLAAEMIIRVLRTAVPGGRLVIAGRRCPGTASSLIRGSVLAAAFAACYRHADLRPDADSAGPGVRLPRRSSQADAR